MRAGAARMLAVGAFVLLGAGSAFAQTGALSGRVVDAESGETIANCFVTYTPAPAANQAPQIVATTGGC